MASDDALVPSVNVGDSLSSAQETCANISKSQLKKLRRHQKWIESKPERRRREKEKRKLKRQLLAKERDSKDDLVIIERPRVKLMKDSNNKFRIVVDLNFEQYMTDSEIAKSVKQVGRIYTINRHATSPCQLYISSLNGKIRERFSITNRGYENWDIHHSECDYVDLFRQPVEEEMDKTNFIYLTGDSNETLPDVDTLLTEYESKIFIIGGLVDHNRHKNLCLQLAENRGIKTAKLPIEQHVKLCQRQILSTVTVFEILLEVLGNHKQWSEALLSTIPKRKLAAANTDQSKMPETFGDDKPAVEF